ncbi:YncE family protein [Micromonospora sp. GCM10011542]|uniref:YncE family protein n=1 Tax=Micromonospora sp. GCM10011542 TaxID=3317337 RepID=UPI00360BB8CC
MTARRSISRRTILAVLAGSGTAALLGCDPTPDAASAAGIPDPLLLDVDRGIGVLRGAGCRTVPDAIATADGLAVYATAVDGADTALWRTDTATGRASTQIRLPGRWLPRAVSANGAHVALTPVEAVVSAGRPAGREVTPVLVADESGVRHRLDLRGNVVPEAFTDDLAGLFVLDWLPARTPDRYRVRVVDLATGTSGPLSTRAKEPVPPGAEEEMRGEGRQAVLAPDRTTLYTLYTHQPDHQHSRDLVSGRPGNAHAFVHTLNLAERWAYCIDLPHPFGAASASGHALAISPDGGRLHVVDVASGSVAEISAQDLAVRRTATLTRGAGTGYAGTSRDRLFVGAGTTVCATDPATLDPITRWSVREPVCGLVPSADGTRVHVGQTNAVSWHDPATGRELGRVAVPGLVRLRGLAGG